VGLEVVWVVSLKLVAASVEESVLLLPILEKEENKNGGVDCDMFCSILPLHMHVMAHINRPRHADITEMPSHDVQL
jgi:hypothetical protein